MNQMESNHKKRSVLSNAGFSYYYLKQYCGMKFFFITPIFVLLSVANPFVSMAFPSIAVSQMLSQKQPEHILLVVLLVAASIQILQIAQIYISDLVHQISFMYRIKFVYLIHEHSLSMDYASLESTTGQKMLSKGEYATYYGNDTGIEAFINQINQFMIQSLGLLLYSLIVGRQNLWILLFLLVTTGVVSYMNSKAEKYEREHKEEQRKEFMRYHYLCQQSIDTKNAKDLRLYPMKEWLLQAMNQTIDRILGYIKEALLRYDRAKTADQLLALIRDAFVYGYFIQQMVTGRIEVNQFILYVGVTAGFNKWMEGIFAAYAEIIRNNIIMDDCRDYLEYGKAEERKMPQEFRTRRGRIHEITLEHVSYRYPEAKEDTIKDVNVTIRKGEKLALVGMNGAGKTTLVKLICGLYKPTEGRILIDGIDAASIPVNDYYEEFSVVFQDVFTFSFPLSDNVTCQEKKDQEKDKMDRCLEQAGLLERVKHLPKKEDTMMNKDIDKEGVTLSGGEMQKLMLARALYKEAPVILLDEPTAALDPIAESEMYEKYNSLIQGKSSVFISHRLSSTKFCDRILFLEDGRVMEEGTHEELMQMDGDYAHMFWVQAHYYQEDKEVNCSNA